MEKLKKFIKTTLLGGIGLLLPIILSVIILRWLFTVITNQIAPMTQILVQKTGINKTFADGMTIAVIIIICFVVGVLGKTGIGGFVHRTLEKRILTIMPGYTLFRSTIRQFLGQKTSPFSRIALVRPYDNDTMMTAFITDEHPGGYYTVFAPSALNPTTGLILHLKKEKVHLVDVSIEDAMRSIITCGTGSCKLLSQVSLRQGAPLGKDCPGD